MSNTNEGYNNGISAIAKECKCSDESIRISLERGYMASSIPFFKEVIYHYKTSNSMQKTADNFSITKARVWQIVHEYKG